MPDVNNDLQNIKIKQLTSNYLNDYVDVAGVRILAAAKKTASGDFHVVVRYEDTVYILAANGSGHSLSVGLRFTDLFTQLASSGHSIITIASKINDELYQYKHQDYLVALTFVKINEHSGFIDVLNCGNPTALLLDEDGQFLHTFKSKALACGAVENGHYDRLIEHINYTRTARLYVLTAGIYDALIQNGLSQNSFEYEYFYKRHPDNCFNDICTYIEQSQSKSSSEDLTLIEINLKQPNNIAASAKSTDEIKTKFLKSNEIKELLADSKILCIDPLISSLQSVNQALSDFVGNLYLCQTVEETITTHLQYSPDLIIIDLPFLLKHQAELSCIFPKNDSSSPIIITCEPSNIIVAEQLFALPITRYLRKSHITTGLLNKVKDCLNLSIKHEYRQFNYAVFQESSLAMTITDADKNIVQVNDAFCTITGYQRKELISCNPKLLSSGRHDASFYQRMWDSINSTGHWSGEIWNKRKNGELFLEWITINAIKNEYNKVVSYCSVFSDITERKAVDEAIKKLSNYDDLTELPNRRLFKTTLKNTIDNTPDAGSLAVLFLDLDKFKEINDTLGHEFGDLVLKETAIRLKKCIRDSDLLARLGGDEFTICLTPNDSNAIDIVTKKILDEMSTKSFKIKGEEIHLSISIGAAVYPIHGEDVSSLLKHADQAMFYAKQEGRNCVRFFSSSMETSALEKRVLIHDLHLAVKQQQFELFYQPIIELQTNSMHKAEALIRWHHPEKGIISPDKFIPLAEETGLIIKIGDWVFEQAVAQCKQWRTTISPQFQISINKSPKQFGKDRNHYLEWINHLNLNQLPASAIAVEITEGVLMDSKEAVFKELLSFRDQGIQVSLDDFGTGHSSLAYLRKFDIDYLKIDREFVQHVETSSDDQALCKAIITMAHTLGLKVIAEGIETAWQKDFFVNAACDFGQGYFFSKPITAEQFGQYVVKKIDD